jgi:hypothetical protein
MIATWFPEAVCGGFAAESAVPGRPTALKYDRQDVSLIVMNLL